jgi:phage terminase large subunit-like protein
MPDLIGQPLLKEAGADWGRDAIRAIFGSWDRTANTREIDEFFFLIPKKSVKTGTAAEIALTALLFNQRPGAEFVLLGPSKEIASRAYNHAANTIRADREGFLQKRFHPKDNIKEIFDRTNRATVKVLTFDTGIATGVKPVGIVIDELHEISKISSASDVIVQLRGGMIGNPEAFMVFITTQSVDPPAGVFLTELKKARGIRDGRIKNIKTLPVLYEYPEEIIRSGEWKDPKIWGWVNPNLGKSITIARLEALYAAALEAGEHEVKKWASQHLNIEIGISLGSNEWEGARHWEACAEKTLTLPDLLRRCDVVVGGIDGGGLDDLLGLCFIGREISTRKWLHWIHAWCHSSVLGLRKEIAPRLQDFAALGQLTIVDHVGDDVMEVCDYIELVEDAGLFPEKGAIGVDPVGITDIIDELERRNFDVSKETLRIVNITQGWQLTNHIKSLARRVAAKDIVHGNQALMAWCIGNAKVEPRGNAIAITKEAAGRAKIDPLMATFNATALMSRNPDSTKSVYGSRGLLVI